MVIRPANEGDCEAIAAATNVYIRGTAVHFAYEPVTADEWRALWVKGREKYPWLVGAVDGKFAGYAKAGVWRDRAAYQWSCEAGIYMTKESQGKGLGKRLYGALLQELKRRGFHSVIGGLTLPNDASVKLHEALGFVHVGTVKEAGWKMGSWHSVAFYQAMLRDESHRVEV